MDNDTIAGSETEMIIAVDRTANYLFWILRFLISTFIGIVRKCERDCVKRFEE
jgi:hypothetical protein